MIHVTLSVNNNKNYRYPNTKKIFPLFIKDKLKKQIKSLII